MATKNVLPLSRLHELLRLDDETGRLYWRVARSVRRKPGDEALTAANSEGYRSGVVDGISLKAHRVVWALHHGEWPKGVIDHIDGDVQNNLPANLRDVEESVNFRNAWMPKNNTSGVCGVSWCKKSKAWKAHIRNNRKREHLGQFQDFSAACEARWSAERKYGFTDRHGTPRPNNPDRKVA